MSNEKSKGGISIGMVLFLIFLTLKLAKVGVVANWSWWWVTSPLWIVPSIIIVSVFLGAIVIGIIKALKRK
jgi:membrane protein YdbS with pleckstrin-like domain